MSEWKTTSGPRGCQTRHPVHTIECMADRKRDGVTKMRNNHNIIASVEKGLCPTTQ